MSEALVRAGTQAESERLERLFHQLDANGDGRIDMQELYDGLNSLGYHHISKEHVEEFLRHSDVDGSGDLNMKEFVSYLQDHTKKLHIVFSKLDQNKDGAICINEIVEGFKKMGIFVSENEAAALLYRIDEDNSLDITFEEWWDYLLFHPSSDFDNIIKSWRNTTIVGSVHSQDIQVPDNYSKQDIVTGMWWRHLVAGGVAGAVSRTATAPLERLVAFLRCHGGPMRLGVFASFKWLLKEGGIRGLWRGNGINVLKIPVESAMKFVAYDSLKRLIVNNDKDRDLLLYERFLAGSLAGGITQTCIYPLEVIKTRLTLRHSGEYTGIFDCGKKLYRSAGWEVFYRGYIPNIVGILPYAGIDLIVYETLKRNYLDQLDKAGGSRDTGIWGHGHAIPLLCFGAFSSCVGQTATYPLAVVRTKLQNQAGLNLNLPKEQSVGGLFGGPGLFSYIMRTEGIKGLYRGMVPNLIKVFPAVSISYYVYEKTRELLISDDVTVHKVK